MKKNNSILIVIMVIVVGTVSFYGGMLYHSGNPSQGSRNIGGPNGGMPGFPNGSRNGRNQMGNFMNGEILKLDSTSITVKMRDGTSRIVYLSGATKIQKSTEGSTTDLSVGKQVMVTGKQSDDGTVSADMIQIRSDMPFNDGIQNANNLPTNPNLNMVPAPPTSDINF